MSSRTYAVSKLIFRINESIIVSEIVISCIVRWININNVYGFLVSKI